jgi:hypothetical protein
MPYRAMIYNSITVCGSSDAKAAVKAVKAATASAKPAKTAASACASRSGSHSVAASTALRALPSDADAGYTGPDKDDVDVDVVLESADNDAETSGDESRSSASEHESNGTTWRCVSHFILDACILS